MRKLNKRETEGGAKGWLKSFDQFPNIYSTRVSYNSKESRQTLTGAFCTILLVVILIGITIIYMIPVINKQNYTLTTRLLPQSDSKYSLKYGKSYLVYWTLWASDGKGTKKLDRSKVSIRV